MSDRPLTPPCVPFGTRRFNQGCKDSYFARILKYPACASLAFVIVCIRMPLPANRTVYAHSEEECEAMLAEMIERVKGERKGTPTS